MFQWVLHLQGGMGTCFVVVAQEVDHLGAGRAGGVGDSPIEFFLDGSVDSFDGSVIAGGCDGDKGLLEAIGL